MALDRAALEEKYPLIKQMRNYEPIFWENPDFNQVNQEGSLPFSLTDIFAAWARWQRFRSYFEASFPDTYGNQGMIESPLIKTMTMLQALEQHWQEPLPGQLFVKADNQLPIAGSIKARGGIYAVLKIAEDIALNYSDLVYEDNYALLSSKEFQELFQHFKLVVGSTGNLGLSIGTIGRKLGFQVTVHMSKDAKQWKKDRLRALGVHVIEHDADFTQSLNAARTEAKLQKHTYFIDDENSTVLFMGYATAAIHFQMELKQSQILPTKEHPLFVYLPAGVGGSPAGVAYGLKLILGTYVYPIFVEPTHSPSVTLGMMTGLNHDIAVYDVGLDGKTVADGLAVPRPSKLAGKSVKNMIFGSATFEDDDILQYLNLLAMSENILTEPSADAGFAGYKMIVERFGNQFDLQNANHVVWLTGGSLVPKIQMAEYIKAGQALLHPKLDNFVKF